MSLKLHIPSRSIDADSASPSSSLSTSRKNEHLAVLLPKHLWKPDSYASRCDTFSCEVKFSLFERRHHCRKCGGVYCQTCTSRTTPLLDTSHLHFLYPPRNVPISAFDSPTSPVLDSRVCDDCYDQIHCSRSSSSPSSPRLPTKPILVGSLQSSVASSICSSVSTPPDDVAISAVRPALSRTSSSSHVVLNRPVEPVLISGAHKHLRLSADQRSASFGELDAYPLKHSSAVCKATGGGRWTPRRATRLVGERVPGCKAGYELELEWEEEQRRLRKLNPVLRDGEFQLRVPREMEPRSVCGPFLLSTF
ncbi:hypothetical protein JAAARDRAFT_71762 [Jaapia argillacea MUCL 33604]|uniref:FYVE-type domain-containing protein n=1 Tax=Jaapia argillacea MUCL 33604 TaxID=933084 RepID=A0A067PJC1_9AGAM|nr:hypothetical protein JAAARDRAFT_71762 [Jaapia argillacea MUCL 33604]